MLGVDLDPQASLCKWGDRRVQETPAIMPMLASRLVPTLDSAREHGVEIAVIDTAGRARDEALAAVQVADTEKGRPLAVQASVFFCGLSSL